MIVEVLVYRVSNKNNTVRLFSKMKVETELLTYSTTASSLSFILKNSAIMKIDRRMLRAGRRPETLTHRYEDDSAVNHGPIERQINICER